MTGLFFLALAQLALGTGAPPSEHRALAMTAQCANVLSASSNYGVFPQVDSDTFCTNANGANYVNNALLLSQHQAPSGFRLALTLTAWETEPGTDFGGLFTAAAGALVTASSTCTLTGGSYTLQPLVSGGCAGQCLGTGFSTIECPPPLTFSPTLGTCQSCAAGTQYNLAASACTPCAAPLLFSPAGGNCTPACPRNTYANATSRACLPCPFNSTSPGGTADITACAPSCYGVCPIANATLDNRRLALPCPAGSHVFLQQTPQTLPFTMVLESAAAPIVTGISASVSGSTNALLSWGTAPFALSLSSPPQQPLNSSQAAQLIAGLRICSTLSPSAIPSFGVNVTVTLSLATQPPGATSAPRTAATPIPLLLLPQPPPLPAWAGRAPPAPANLSVQPASLAYPPLPPPPLTLSSASAPLLPWAATPGLNSSLAWTSPAPAALSRVVVSIASGCLPGDALALPLNASFFGTVRAVPHARCGSSGGATTALELLGTGSLHHFLPQLSALTLRASAASTLAASAALLRVLRVEFEGLATLYTAVAVQPSAASGALTAAPAQPLPLPENLPPDFAVAVMRTCAAGPLRVHGLPTQCLAFPDALLFRGEAGVDAYAGAALGPLALQVATAFNFSFSGHSSSSQCAWGALPIGAAVHDCSDAGPPAAPGAATQPRACVWQRFRVVLARAAAPAPAQGVACEGGCALDYESSCAALPAPGRGRAFFNATLSITSAPPAGSGLPPPAPLLLPLALEVVNAEEPAVLALAAGATASALPVLYIDDTTGQPASNASLVTLCSQGSGAFTARVASAALQGANHTLPFDVQGLLAPLLLSPSPPPAPAWLRQSPACAGALTAVSALGAPPAQSWAYATNFTLVVSAAGGAPVDALRRCPTRALGVLLQPSAGAQQAPLYLPVVLTRANRAVSWVRGQPQPALALPEGAPPGAATAALLAVHDSDAEQDVSVTVLGAALLSCNGTRAAQPYSAPRGLLVAVPLVNLTNVTDAATGATASVPSSRRFALVLARDALSNQGAAEACGLAPSARMACTYNLTLLAQDNGDPTPSHSLLPLQNRTSATAHFNFTVTAATGASAGCNSSGPASAVTGIRGVPPAGLSAGGGDVLYLQGCGLGLTDAGSPAGAVAVSFFSGSAEFPLADCAVLEHQVLLRCATSPGFGAVSRLRVRVGSVSTWQASCAAAGAAAAACLALPSYQAPRVLAVLQQLSALAPGTSGTAAVWHALQPRSGPPPAPAADLPSLLAASPALAYAPPPANLTLLVDGVPSAAVLAALQVTPLVRAVIVLEAGAYLPLGACTRAAAAPAADPQLYSPLAAGHPVFNASLTLPAPLASASWYDCQLPSLSAGAFRQLAVSVDFNASSGAAAAAASEPGAPEPDPLPVLPGAPGNASSPALPLQLASAAASVTAAALPARLPPSITALLQPTPGGSFTVTGANLGSPALAWHSDRVEYHAVAACSGAQAAGAALAVSCAVHAGVGCRYAVNHSQVECDMEEGGWGAGFAARVVVGGQASAWFGGGSLSYAPPLLQRLSAAAVSGLNASASAAAAVAAAAAPGAGPGGAAAILEPAGGGLLVLQGQNLWPVQALVITVGGVRVSAINARPLQQRPAALLQPLCNSSCFGDASQAWTAQQQQQQSSSSAVVVPYPPGVGSVNVTVWLGLNSSTLPATYGAPQLLRVLASQPDAAPNTYTLYLTSARLSPCVHCLGGSLCAVAALASNSSSFAAARVALPAAGSGEGALPQPLPQVATNSTFSIASCALPDALWTWVQPASQGSSSGSGSPPSTWTRQLLDSSSLPAASLTQGSALRMPSVTLKADLGSDLLQADGASVQEQGIVLDYVYNGTVLSRSNSFVLTQAELTTPDPKVISLTPAQWVTNPAPQQQQVTLSVENTGPLGAVLVYPAGGWTGGPIACPIVPSTAMLLTDIGGNLLPPEAASLFTAKLNIPASGNATARTYLDVWSASTASWAESTAPLPCSVASWMGSESPSALVLPGQQVRITQPAWLGTVQVEIFTKGKLSSSQRSATYAAPALAAIEPTSGASTGGYPATIRGVNLGLAGSLGGIWNCTGAAALSRAIVARLYSSNSGSGSGSNSSNSSSVWLTAPPSSWNTSVAPDAFPHSVFFAYLSTPTNASSGLRRTAQVSSWADTAVTFSAPEGVAESVNVPTLSLDYASPLGREELVQAGALFAFKYLPPNVTKAEWVYPSSSSSSSSSGAPVRIRLLGSGLSRFTAAPSGGSVDVTEGGRWTYSILVKAVSEEGRLRGMVNGAPDLLTLAQDASTQTFTNDAIEFAAPAVLEGLIELSVQLIYSDGTNPAPTPPVRLAALPPVITSVTVVPTALDDDSNPCLDLLTTAPAGAALNASSPSRACLQGIYSFFQPPLALAAQAAREPCFRVTPSAPSPASPTSSGTLLRITGRHLGAGRWTQLGVALYSLALAGSVSVPALAASGDPWQPSLTAASSGAAAGEGGAGGAGSAVLASAAPASAAAPAAPLVQCNINQNLTTWGARSGDESVVFCALSATAALPLGPVELLLGAAFSRASATSAGLALTGACPCGTYADAPGQACSACDEAAFCLGGLQPPLARAGVWETKASEWAARGLTLAVPGALLTPPAPRWVPCATPSECLPNNTCSPGTDPGSFMCTSCLASARATYARGSAGACELCSPALSVALVVSVALGLPLLLAGALGAAWCCARTECARALRQAGGACAGAAGARLCPCVCGAARQQPRALTAAAAAAAAQEEDAAGAAARPPPAALAAAPKRDPQPILALLRIAVTFLQTLGALSLYTSSTHVRGRADPPDTLIIPGVLRRLSFFLDMGLSMSEFACATAIGYREKLLLMGALPWAIVLLAPGLVSAGGAALRGAQAALHACATRALRLTGAAAAEPLQPLHVSAPLVTLSLLFFALPTVISSLARAQDCASEAEGGYLYSDPTVSCALPDVVALTTNARYLAYFYILCPPAVVLLWGVHSLPGFAFFDPLTAGYHSMSYVAKYWEVITLVRKAVLLGLATHLLQFEDPRSQAIATSQFLAFCMVLHLSVWPFGDRRSFNATLNWLESLALAGCIAFSLAVTARLQSRLGTDLPLPVKEQNELDFVALGLCAPFAATWSFLFLDSLLAGGAMAPRVTAAAAAALAWLSRKVARPASAQEALRQAARARAGRASGSGAPAGSAEEREESERLGKGSSAVSPRVAASRSRRQQLGDSTAFLCSSSGSGSGSGSGGSAPTAASPLQQARTVSQRRLAASQLLQAMSDFRAALHAPRAPSPFPYFDEPQRMAPPPPPPPPLQPPQQPQQQQQPQQPEEPPPHAAPPPPTAAFSPAPAASPTAPPRERSASDIARGLWRLRAGAPRVWVQDGTGDTAPHHPPLGARLAGAWVVVRSVHAEEGYVFFNEERYARGQPALSFAVQPVMELLEPLRAQGQGQGQGQREEVVVVAEPAAGGEGAAGGSGGGGGGSSGSGITSARAQFSPRGAQHTPWAWPGSLPGEGAQAGAAAAAPAAPSAVAAYLQQQPGGGAAAAAGFAAADVSAPAPAAAAPPLALPTALCEGAEEAAQGGAGAGAGAAASPPPLPTPWVARRHRSPQPGQPATYYSRLNAQGVKERRAELPRGEAVAAAAAERRRQRRARSAAQPLASAPPPQQGGAPAAVSAWGSGEEAAGLVMRSNPLAQQRSRSSGAGGAARSSGDSFSQENPLRALRGGGAAPPAAPHSGQQALAARGGGCAVV